MSKLLITGGTVFASKFITEYFVSKEHEVYVINRNSKPQVDGVHLIEADRHDLMDTLRGMHFDVVIDVTAYNANDILCLTDALDSFD